VVGFLDASMIRYGLVLPESDHGDAYRKAGVAFKRQLEQNFVVLHDKIESAMKG
jgi:hypothetical protein